MRKIFVLFFSVFVLFSGCESLDNTPSSSLSGTGKFSSNNASFDEAYTWRTGKAEEKMLWLKNNKALDDLRVSNPTNYIKRVVWEINSAALSDFEKVKMAHDITVLAVSDDYANVFKELCDQLKFPCEIVHGYACGVGNNSLNESNVQETNHAWNMVKVKGTWYLVDCAWDAGQMEGYETKQEYRTDWLFMKPEHFIYTHLPSNKNNQLVFPRISPERFSDLPELRPNFFDSVNSVPSNLKKMNYCDESFRFPLDTKTGYNITFTIEDISDSSEVIDCYSIKTSGSRKYATFSFPKAGQYSVKMFSWKDGVQIGEYCGKFFVESSRDNTNIIATYTME